MFSRIPKWRTVDGKVFGRAMAVPSWLFRGLMVALGGVPGLAQTYTVTELPGFAWQVNQGAAINNRGDVAYSAVDALSNAIYAALYSGGMTFRLGDFVPAAMNNLGQIVGSTISPSGTPESAVLYSAGSLINLGTLNGDLSSGATGINDLGEVVGWSASNGNVHAFLHSGRNMVNLNCRGHRGWKGAVINNRGQIATGCYDDAGMEHIMLYSGGSRFDLAAADVAYAGGINDRGQVSGFLDTGPRHPFLYAAGKWVDLGALIGADFLIANAYGVNEVGEVVGVVCSELGSECYGFLLLGGHIFNLNDLVSLPDGVRLNTAFAINDRGQIVGMGGDGNLYLLTPVMSTLSAFNPFALSAKQRQAPPVLDLHTVLASPTANSVAADGMSAVVLSYQSESSAPVTFQISATGDGLADGTAVGALGEFQADYLPNPSPPTDSRQTLSGVLPINRRASGGCDGSCVFLVLLWGPDAMPVAGTAPLVHLTVRAAQSGVVRSARADVAVVPPPLLLVHGIWSSAAGTGYTSGTGGFYDWISTLYPADTPIVPVDYSEFNGRRFDDAAIQQRLLDGVSNALATAAQSAVAARRVDVVGHSMGGLVARYFLSTNGYLQNPALLPEPFHKLITIGTPHQGSQLADFLQRNQDKNPILTSLSPVAQAWCTLFSSCTLGSVMAATNHALGAGVRSLVPGSDSLRALSSSNKFQAIVGQAPAASVTESALNVLINDFVPGNTISGILGGSHDTIVARSSQVGGASASAVTISGVVHTSMCSPGPLSAACSDTGETYSLAVWSQAFDFLTGGTGAVAFGSAAAPRSRASRTSTTAAPPPRIDLTGYSRVPESSVSITPPSGSVLTINNIASITATTPTKTIQEVLLLETAADPGDTPLQYATQPPFTISFTPLRLGNGAFTAITVFTDLTYTTTALTYSFQPPGSPWRLNLLNAPTASISPGASTVVRVQALYANGLVDVTESATYGSASGTVSVFRADSGGSITATGVGIDTLKVSYGGATAEAPISVGGCQYSLSPANQMVSNSGGVATVQVSGPAGCAWALGGGASWLTTNNGNGIGNGTVSFTAQANESGQTRAVLVTLGSLSVVVTQPGLACSYTTSKTVIHAPAAGASGTLTVTTACPLFPASDQPWLTTAAFGVSVQYRIAANSEPSPRSATLTIGSLVVPVVQTSPLACQILGTGPSNVNDVQQIINEALSAAPPIHDLSGDNQVNAADVQIIVGDVMGLGCSAT